MKRYRYRTTLLILAAAGAVLLPRGADGQGVGGAAAVADTLTLPEAVRSALGSSPGIRAAEAQRSMGSAAQWSSWGQVLPSLRLSSGINQIGVLQRTATDPFTGGIVALPDSLIERRQTFGTAASLSLDWTVFDGGRRLGAIRQARAETDAADAALDLARGQIAGTVALAYLEALEARALEGLNEAELERATELVRLTEGRFEVGQVPEIDVLQARIAAGDAELALLEARSGREAAMLALAEYVPGLSDSPAALVEIDAASVSLPSPDEITACRLDESPEIAGLRSQVEAARRGVEMSRSWALPTLTVGTTWQRSELGQTRDALTLNPNNQQAFYRVSLSWTPFEQPGQVLAERQLARANRESREALFQQRRATLTREVKLAADRLGRAVQQEERRMLNLRLAELQREQASERYRVGVSSLLEQLQGEALAREAERQAIAARYAALRALADLQRLGAIDLSWQSGTWSCPRS
jgi:outer membrane protein TolC